MSWTYFDCPICGNFKPILKYFLSKAEYNTLPERLKGMCFDCYNKLKLNTIIENADLQWKIFEGNYSYRIPIIGYDTDVCSLLSTKDKYITCERNCILDCYHKESFKETFK